MACNSAHKRFKDIPIHAKILTCVPGMATLDSIRSWAYQKTGIPILSFELTYDDQCIIDSDPYSPLDRLNLTKESELTMLDMSEIHSSQEDNPKKTYTTQSHPYLVSKIQQVCKIIPGVKYAERIRLLVHDKSGISLLSYPLVSRPKTRTYVDQKDEEEVSSASTLCSPSTPTYHDRFIYILSFVPGIQILDYIRSFAYEKTHFYIFSFHLVDIDSVDNPSSRTKKSFLQRQWDKIDSFKRKIKAKYKSYKEYVKRKWTFLKFLVREYGDKEGILILFNHAFYHISWTFTVGLGYLSNFIDYRAIYLERYLFGHVQPRRFPLYGFYFYLYY